MDTIYIVLIILAGVVAGCYFPLKKILKKRGTSPEPPSKGKLKPVEFKRVVTPGRVEYEFQNGLKAAMVETDLVQDTALMEIIGGIKLSDWKSISDVDFNKLHGYLKEEKYLHKFLDIILIEKAHPSVTSKGESFWPLYDSLKSTELEAIQTDFFALNPKFKQMLLYLGTAAVLKAMSKDDLQTLGNETIKNLYNSRRI